MTTDLDDQLGDDPEIGRLLRDRLPRHPAPPHLRVALVNALEPPHRRWWEHGWLTPVVSVLATAMVMLMWTAHQLPGGAPVDSVRIIARAAVSEHARTLSWGDEATDVLPVSLPRAIEESGIDVRGVFAGDDELSLINISPTYIDVHRGMAIAYADEAGHAVTQLILPASALTLPEGTRTQIGRWRATVLKENGFSLIVWKQQGFLCVLVADLVSPADLERFKGYFAKIRSATEIRPI